MVEFGLFAITEPSSESKLLYSTADEGAFESSGSSPWPIPALPLNHNALPGNATGF
jgi:hypothetical protein